MRICHRLPLSRSLSFNKFHRRLSAFIFKLLFVSASIEPTTAVLRTSILLTAARSFHRFHNNNLLNYILFIEWPIDREFLQLSYEPIYTLIYFDRTIYSFVAVVGHQIAVEESCWLDERDWTTALPFWYDSKIVSNPPIKFEIINIFFNFCCIFRMNFI